MAEDQDAAARSGSAGAPPPPGGWPPPSAPPPPPPRPYAGPPAAYGPYDPYSGVPVAPVMPGKRRPWLIPLIVAGSAVGIALVLWALVAAATSVLAPPEDAFADGDQYVDMLAYAYVGDCVEPIETVRTTDVNVRIVGCSEPHEYQIFFTFSEPGGAPQTGAAATAAVQEQCEEAAVGRVPATGVRIVGVPLGPQSYDDGWDTSMCLVGAADRTKLDEDIAGPRR